MLYVALYFMFQMESLKKPYNVFSSYQRDCYYDNKMAADITDEKIIK